MQCVCLSVCVWLSVCLFVMRWGGLHGNDERSPGGESATVRIQIGEGALKDNPPQQSPDLKDGLPG